MRLNYDRKADSLTLVLNEDPVYEKDKIGPGVVANFAVDGSLIGLEVSNASARIDGPGLLEVIGVDPA